MSHIGPSTVCPADYLLIEYGDRLIHIDDLVRGLPPRGEIARLRIIFDDRASDDPSRDRYGGLVPANAVEGHWLALDAREPF